MENFVALLKCFGERYINCDDEQAKLDLANREPLVSAFNALTDYAERLAGENE